MSAPSQPALHARRSDGTRRARAMGSALLAVVAAAVISAQQGPASGVDAPLPLMATAHQPLPAEPARVWYVSAGAAPAVSPAMRDFARGVERLGGGEAAQALPLLSAAPLTNTPAARYARYYTGVAHLALGRLDEAEAALAAVAAQSAGTRLGEETALRLAEVRLARSDARGAADLYRQLTTRPLAAPAQVWLQLARAREAAGDAAGAIDAYRFLALDYPLSEEAREAVQVLTRAGVLDDGLATRLPREWQRAHVLFEARRWDEAKEAYARIRRVATREADEALAAVREAACDIQRRRYVPARETLRAQAAGPSGIEAQFYLLAALRVQGSRDEYIRQVQAFVDGHPDSPLAESALNDLATFYIVADEDAEAEAVFLRMLDRYPAGRFAERAAWRAGWWAYRRGAFAQTIRLFERGAATFPRSDFRPSWIYWIARSYDQLGATGIATERYRLAATDYLNSYYGRLAWRRLEARGAASVLRRVERAPVTLSPLPNAADVSLLVALEMHEDALAELRFAQRTAGDSPALQATMALVQHRLGNLRVGINGMKRAYPQYLAAGGEQLPPEVQRVLFPLDYWPLLQDEARRHGLDPYLLAALVAQESTFDPVVVSSANAVGLMQLLPSTARRYARKLGLRGYSAGRLIDPATNIRLGTAYFADLVRQFGGAHYALASYNAGESRVAVWRRERPDLPQDEFVDDIPFPETQNYVKRILGTAEDYRRLYGPGSRSASGTRSGATRR